MRNSPANWVYQFARNICIEAGLDPEQTVMSPNGLQARWISYVPRARAILTDMEPHEFRALTRTLCSLYNEHLRGES